jgi:phosphoribosyl-ATP pyrophosphohydrolase/phosphoribosyl-AMP cyclohydrolase
MIDFDKQGGLVPVVIQHYATLQVLMVGYMNQAAYEKTITENVVTFFSRSKKRLWTKGETSGNFLLLKECFYDCDKDTLLMKVKPSGPVCHTGSYSCFGDQEEQGFIYDLERTISSRIENKEENSYTYKIYSKGINKVAQKVGEEAVELVIESKDEDDKLFLNEAADLLYHFLILLNIKNKRMRDVEAILLSRSVSK